MFRYPSNGKIPRAKNIPQGIRPKVETEYASIMGHRIHDTKSWYRDIYEYYQSNEV